MLEAERSHGGLNIPFIRYTHTVGLNLKAKARGLTQTWTKSAFRLPTCLPTELDTRPGPQVLNLNFSRIRSLTPVCSRRVTFPGHGVFPYYKIKAHQHQARGMQTLSSIHFGKEATAQQQKCNYNFPVGNLGLHIYLVWLTRQVGMNSHSIPPSCATRSASPPEPRKQNAG